MYAVPVALVASFSASVSEVAFLRGGVERAHDIGGRMVLVVANVTAFRGGGLVVLSRSLECTDFADEGSVVL